MLSSELPHHLGAQGGQNLIKNHMNMGKSTFIKDLSAMLSCKVPRRRDDKGLRKSGYRRGDRGKRRVCGLPCAVGTELW